MNWSVISLGGSVIAPQLGAVNQAFIADFTRLLVTRQQQTKQHYAIVTGGGAVARSYQQALRDFVDGGGTDSGQTATAPLPYSRALDMIGIAATRIHAELIAAALEVAATRANGSAASTPPPSTNAPSSSSPSSSPRISVILQQIADKAELPADADYLVSGGWHPGVSTDYIAVQLACYLGAGEVINISDTAYIYDADPRKHHDAARYTSLSWQQYTQIIGGEATWQPGAHLPFDPYAAKLAATHHITVRFVAPQIDEVQHGLDGEPHNGTVIDAGNSEK